MLENNFIRFVLLGILFFLPFSGGIWLLDQVEKDDWLKGRNASLDSLNRHVARFSQLGGASDNFQAAADRIRAVLLAGGDPTPVINILPANTVEVFLYSQSGKRLFPPGFSRKFIRASEKCLSFIRKMGLGKAKTLSLSEEKMAGAFLGSSRAIPMMAENPGKLHNLESVGETRSVGIFPLRTKTSHLGFFIFSLNHRHISQRVLLQQAQTRMEKLVGPQFRFNFLDMKNMAYPQAWKAAGIPSPVRKLFAGSSFGNHFECNGKYWCFTILDRQFLLMGNTGAKIPLSHFLHRRRVALGSGLVCFAAFLVLFFLLSQRGISIRVQSALMFSLASFGCIAVLLGFGALYTESLRSSLHRKRLELSHEILAKADAGFSGFLRGIDRRHREFISGLSSRLDSPALLTGAFSRLEGLGKRFSIGVIDSSGKVLYWKESPADSELQEVWGEDYIRMMTRIAQKAQEIYSFDLQFGVSRTRMDITGTNAIVANAAEKFNDHRSSTTTLILGKKSLTMFFDYIRDPGGSPLAAIWITHKKQTLENLYSRSLFRSHRNKNLQMPFPFRIFSVRPSGSFDRWPAKGLPVETIREMNGSIYQAMKSLSRIIRIGSKSFLLVGSPCKHLGMRNLFVISPLSAIERRAESLFYGFGAFSALVIIFTIALSQVFSRLLLDPVRSISHGLQRLSNSDFRFELPIQTGDEFQEIGRGIKEIVGEMAELSLAKSIQEHLLPHGPLVTPRTECHGWSRSYSDIGGEIFDFQELDSGKTVVWIANFPGHSIESALLLAMTKMAIRLLLQLSPKSAKLIIDDLFAHFRERVYSYEKGCFLIAFIDHATRGLEVAGRGKFRLLRGGSKQSRNSGAEDRGSPDRVSPGRVSSDRGSPDRVSPSRISSDRVVDVDLTPFEAGSDVQVANLELFPGERIFILSPGWDQFSTGLKATQGWMSSLEQTLPLPVAETGSQMLKNLEEPVTPQAGQKTRTLLACEVLSG